MPSEKTERIATLKTEIKDLKRKIEGFKNDIATARRAGRQPKRAHAAVQAVAKIQARQADAQRSLDRKQAELKRLS